MESYLSGEKNFCTTFDSPVQVQLPLPSTICCHFRQLLRKILCRISISQSSFEMLFQHLSLRSLLNVTSAVRQAIERTSWFKKRQRYRVLYWREIGPYWLFTILLENACVLLMGVLSTFLVSWLGKEAMAGVGLADSFNMVIMSFFAAIDLGTTVVVAFSLGKRDRRRARAAARQSLAIMTLFSILLAGVIHALARRLLILSPAMPPQVKDLALTYLELTALSYPAAAIALIGSGALRGAGTTKIPLLINGGMNILNILIGGIVIYGIFSWPGLGFVGAGLGLTIARYIGAIATIWVLMVGLNPALRLSLKGYFKPFNFAIIWEVMGIGIPASIESVLFNGGKLLTQMFVAGMGTNVIAGNFIAFSVASLINLPGNTLGSASTIITGKRLGKGQIGQAEFQAWHVFWLWTIILTLIAWGSAPFAGFIASFYTHEEDVKEVVKQLLWLNALFMPIWSLSWTLPCAFKGARDVRYTMWVSMLGMWGCRVVAGYTLGIVLGMGVIGVWLGDGARLGGAWRAVLFPHGERPLAVEISARKGFIGGKLSRLRG